VPTVLHQPRETWYETVYVKRNLPTILSKELPKKKSGMVGISTVTDPYQHIEKTYQVTRYCLEQLLKYDFPIQIQTKSDLVLRDSDLLDQFSQVEVMVSIGTNNDQYRKILEPGSPSIQERINILTQLKDDEFIKTSVFLGPLYPIMKWEEIKELLDIFIKNNVSNILVDDLHLKPGLQEYLTHKINDASLLNAFQQHVFSSTNWYQEIMTKIKRYIQKTTKETNITKAF
jgi:DNA repair photolyase